MNIYIQGLKLLRWASSRYGKLDWDELVPQHSLSACKSEFLNLGFENKIQIYGCIRVFAEIHRSQYRKKLICYITQLGLNVGTYFLLHRLLFLNLE